MSKGQKSLEEALHAELRLKSDDTHGDGPRKIYLMQEVEDSANTFVVFTDDSLPTPAILAYSGERQAIEICKEWLKSHLGLIVIPVVLDPSSMLSVADSLALERFYDTRLVFDVVTEAKNLTKMEIEIDKNSLQSLAQPDKNLYSEQLTSYLDQETGMQLKRLPLSSIGLIGRAKVGKSQMTTGSAEIDDSVLQAILKSIQYHV